MSREAPRQKVRDSDGALLDPNGLAISTGTGGR